MRCGLLNTTIYYFLIIIPNSIKYRKIRLFYILRTPVYYTFLPILPVRPLTPTLIYFPILAKNLKLAILFAPPPMSKLPRIKSATAASCLFYVFCCVFYVFSPVFMFFMSFPVFFGLKQPPRCNRLHRFTKTDVFTCTDWCTSSALNPCVDEKTFPNDENRRFYLYRLVYIVSVKSVRTVQSISP